jgi:N-acetylmuramoyl-L-alanine amidase
MLLRVGLRSAAWEGLDVRLGFAPFAVGQEIFVHRLDAEKILFPLLSGQRLLPVNSAPVVVIDPGHGGINAGTRSAASKLYEKDFTMDWAQRLAGLLGTNGWTVWLTRTNDQDLALSNRVAFADQHHADFFLSLHFNSSPTDASQAGLETYCLTPAGMPSTLTRGYVDDPAAAYPNNDFDAQNLLLALQLHREILRATGQLDRGVRHARFLGVLRNQKRPAALIEGAYLSNPREASLAASAGFRQKLAEAVARGLTGMAPKSSLISPPGSQPPASTGTNSGGARDISVESRDSGSNTDSISPP